jgi:hypothetical protein
VLLNGAGTGVWLARSAKIGATSESSIVVTPNPRPGSVPRSPGCIVPECNDPALIAKLKR